ncbi:PTS sugar transporter subunit IIB [Microbacterium terrisoli]|uniref:PTS sugar transporter subunit IIB n=1 Tax=Microbacterium terrisoli TaxID=3242192 RepID=UPI002804D342|nr:PTS sugar transporter [Microbacterium protaetiae]
MRIVVLCGAGASSTFVAQRLRRAFAAHALAHTATAAPLSAMPGCLNEADLLLVGPHLADRIDELARDAAARGVRVMPLPSDIFGDLDGSRALQMVTSAFADAGLSDRAPGPDARADVTPHHTDPAEAGRRREHP